MRVPITRNCVGMLALLVIASSIGGQQPPAPDKLTLTIPDKIQGKAGRIVILNAQTNAKAIVWLTASYQTADLMPLPDGRAVFCSPGGTHQVAVFGVRDNEIVGPVYCQIELGGDQPTPPGPTPPAPPADKLAADLSIAFAAESDLGKREAAKLLALLYDQIGNLATDRAYQTVGDLLKAMELVRQRYVADSALPKTRAVVGEYLRGVLGPPQDPLTDARRASIKAAYTALAEALRRL